MRELARVFRVDITYELNRKTYTDTCGSAEEGINALIATLTADETDALLALRAERERAIAAVTAQANALPADVDDGFYAGYKLAIRNALAALRALD